MALIGPGGRPVTSQPAQNAAGGASPHIKDSGLATFAADVLEASRAVPVIVDFWAPWCGPCKTLAPALEKAVCASKGKVKLVKINIDENPGVAGQLGVRSIPAVYAFDRGRPVDGFTGSVPESQIKLFVDRLSGAGADEDVEALLAQAAESVALGDTGGAAQSYAAVLQLDPENVKAIAGLARAYLAIGQAEEALQLLEMVPPEKAGDPEIAGVRAAMELASQAPQADEFAALSQKVAANPDDHEARFELANAFAASGKLSEAVDHLLTIIEAQRDWNEDAARKQLLKVFEAAGYASDVAKQGRRRLSALLFS
jgi:putative thioredoxin